mmetsp:Transcript_14574/g.25257  ORF Transcript_14574/g.25257 Transcript_14574/m.25257 type:complete len:221 (-) Transcript_14574:155-817(-)
MLMCWLGAGKTHTIKKLDEQGKFPLDSFVSVDPDEIRRRLPEFSTYIQKSPQRAGELTRKEAGMMAEVLTNFALEKGMNVLVDGSLKDAVWYENYFLKLRECYPNLRIGIIHVTAPTEAIFERVQQRGKSTGRVVPMDALIRSIKEVPKAVEQLRKSVDFFMEIHNPPEEDESSSSSSSASTTISTTTITKEGLVSLPNGPTTAYPIQEMENIFRQKCAA